MRLGQLARKLDLRPIEIVEFLATMNIRIEEGTNTKIEDAHATLALHHFAPHLLQDDTPDDEIQTVATDVEPVEPAIVSLENTAFPLENTETETPPVPPEVIKAPKVELSGLKVLGKIELPEPKKKQPETSEENVTDEPPNEFKKEKRNQDFKSRRRPAKNPIALQREQEGYAEQKKREEEIRLQKERRTQNYLKKVKAHQPTKAARLITEQTEEMSAAELAEPPKTWWGKFKRWLTT